MFENNKMEMGHKPTDEEIRRMVENITISTTTRTEVEIPEYKGDYAKAIFLWANAKNSPVKASKDYPGYILYECGIRDAKSFHERLIDEGYFSQQGIEASFENLKMSELKEIANNLGVSSSGKKEDVARRIVNSGKAANLEKQMPIAYSLSEKGEEFVKRCDDCIQIHRHKTWGITWEEFSAKKEECPGASFYEICRKIMFDQIMNDQRGLGWISYFNLSKLEDEYGDPRRAIRYLFQVMYIDVSGFGMFNSYAFDCYKRGIYDKEQLKKSVCESIGFAPANADLIRKHKKYYEPDIIDILYTWKLPIMICERELFEEMVESILDGTYNYQYYKAQLKVRYEKYIDELSDC